MLKTRFNAADHGVFNDKTTIKADKMIWKLDCGDLSVLNTFDSRIATVQERIVCLILDFLKNS